MSLNKSIVFSLVTGCVVIPMMLFGNSSGADPRLTGAPGENTCTSCHNGTPLNGGAGSVRIILPNSATSYTPGVTQRVQVQVSDPSQRRWGFELSARLSSNAGQAGTIASVDGNTRVQTAGGVQYVTHSLNGTRNGTTGGVTFELDWTPPATDLGPVTLYAAANAANGNNQDSGDRIYTTSASITPAAAGTSDKPAITSSRGVVNGASFEAGIAPDSWITIAGTNLAVPGRYISSGQINALAPADASQGNADVRVIVDGQTSDPVTAALQTFSPAFFTFDGKYLSATHADNSLLGRPGLFSSAPTATTPARPGETVILYGTGFGPTSPAIPSGAFTDRLAQITTSFAITIGGLPANVSFGGLVPPYAQLYQFNVEVPTGVGDGDQPVVAQIGGVTSVNTAQCCFITVQR